MIGNVVSLIYTPVMALSGNFSPSRIWVKIPPSAVKVVVFNNSCLGLIFLEPEGVGLPAFREAIEFPNPDFTAFARACGGQGFKASHPDELHGAIADAFAVDRPAIVDCVVVPDERPNLPHIDLNLAKNYAIAKIKEAVIAVTGR